MPATIAVPTALWEQVHDHVMGPGHYAFMLASLGKSPEGIRLTVNHVIPVAVEDHDWDDEHRNLSLDTILGAVNAAKKAGMVLIDVHSHAWPGEVSFSSTDRRGIDDFAAYMMEAMPGKPYAAIVVNQDCARAVWYPALGRRRHDVRVVVAGSGHHVLAHVPQEASGVEDPRYARQAVDAFLGKLGQRRLRDATVAVVGVSGLGSHVAQQLAYLGVGHIILIEPQQVEDSNLNRLIGAGVDDIDLYKADVVARELKRIRGADLRVTVIKKDVRDFAARQAIVGSDLVMGCVDNDGARLVLNRYALAHALPYIDVASGIESPEGVFEHAGGHVAVVLPGSPCYACMDLLDPSEARYFLKPEAEREQDRKLGYAHGWDDPAPSVVSLNGVVAAAAVSEAMCYLTGFTPANPLTMYYLRQPGVSGPRMVSRLVTKNADCIACTHAGLGDAVAPA